MAISTVCERHLDGPGDEVVLSYHSNDIGYLENLSTHDMYIDAEDEF